MTKDGYFAEVVEEKRGYVEKLLSSRSFAERYVAPELEKHFRKLGFVGHIVVRERPESPPDGGDRISYVLVPHAHDGDGHGADQNETRRNASASDGEENDISH